MSSDEDSSDEPGVVVAAPPLRSAPVAAAATTTAPSPPTAAAAAASSAPAEQQLQRRSASPVVSSSPPLLSVSPSSAEGGTLTKSDTRLPLLGTLLNSGRLGRKSSQAPPLQAAPTTPLDEAARARAEGELLVKKKKTAEAIDAFGRALVLEPDNPASYLGRAVAFIKAENFAAAVQDCDRAIALDPVMGAAFARKAKALLALGRADEAAESFEKARAIDAKLPELRKLNLSDMRSLWVSLRGRSTVRARLSAAEPAPPQPQLFGVGLVELLEAQRATSPELEVPEVLLVLVDRLVECDGLRSEGIFRLSIGSDDLQRYLQSLSAGCRNLDTRDPNVYAVILKHFFRFLPEPLCPDFAACMRVVADYNTHDTSASLRRRKELNSRVLAVFSESTLALLEALWASMTVPARAAVRLLCRLFSALLVPENERLTKMSLENLALVFANGVLRDPDPSGVSALASQPSCQRFVTHLYAFVMETGLETGPPTFPLLATPVPPVFRRPSDPPVPRLASPTSPLTSSNEDTSMTDLFGGAARAVVATQPSRGNNSLTLSRSSEEACDRGSGEASRPAPRGKHGSHGEDPTRRNERLLTKFKGGAAARRNSVMRDPGDYKTWYDFFEGVGLSSTLATNYGLAFEREGLELDKCMELFVGGREVHEKVKELCKAGHVIKVQKYLRGQQTGSLGPVKRGPALTQSMPEYTLT